MSTIPIARRYSVPVVTSAALWFALYFAARVLLKRYDLETWPRVAIALAPLVPFAWCLVSIVRAVRAMDELERRIHLEALGFAYPLATFLLMTLALMQRAVTLSFEDWSYAHVWFYLPVFYFFGLILAARRYE